MTGPTPIQQLCRWILRVMSVLWLAWATYHLYVNPLVNNELGRAVLRVTVFVGTSLMFPFYSSLLSKFEEEE